MIKTTSSKPLAMKPIYITLICLFVSTGMAFPQKEEDLVIQPTHVVGRRINDNGEITKELVSDFSYFQNGKLSGYNFPEYAITASFSYSGDFLTHEYVSHNAGEPFHETNLYTYENERIKTISHLMDNMGTSLYWVYSYDDFGRLERKEKKEEDEDDYHQHWLYDYDHDGMTVTESYYTSWVSQGLLLREKTISQYDDSFNLSSTLIEKYEITGELSSSAKTIYYYTPSGVLDKKITQTLHDGTWDNAAITQLAYDENDRIIEQLDGSWNAESDEWDFTHRITFERTAEEEIYTVSFYKKNNNSWIWDTFNGQTIFFESYLKPQQRVLYYLVFEEYNGHGNINQLEFTLEYTNRPTYLSAEKRPETVYKVYPNPSSDKITIEAPVENAVIRLYDPQGRLMLARPFDFTTTVTTGTWPSGMFFWEIWHENRKLTSGKWIKK